MVMEESTMHHHESHSGGDTPNTTNTNVYLVGLEFVRQYYTVLNQGPLYLHRFYSDDSSFVHGASARDSKVAYGQQEIHKRIQGLNFHNCHAKIRQVDSHETLGNGVVIQVTGELSNNGQPMRRFMQTFVLAPQSPKRYYVRNDIFHYQDEVFCDEDGDQEDAIVESGLDTEDHEENEHEPIAVVEINGGSDIIQREPTVEVSVKMSPSPMSAPTPKGEEESSIDSVVQDQVVTVSAAEGPSSDSSISTVPPPSTNEDDAANTLPSNNVTAPKTYANLFKIPSTQQNNPAGQQQNVMKIGSFNFKGANNGPRAASPGNSQFTVGTTDNTTSPPQVSPQSNNAKGLPPRNPRGGGGYINRDSRDRENNRPPYDMRESKDRRERLASRSSTTLNDETGSIDGDRRRPVHTYPDANQLFVGNLPHFTTVQDMKEIFQPFGEVAEVKIQKPTPKSGGMKVPYFCFVVFEDPASAQAAIDKKSEIFMKMNGGAQRRLNVEQKRSQRPNRDYNDYNNDTPYNRTDSSSPAAGRQSDGMGGGGGRGSRTFRGSNRGGLSGDQRSSGDRNDRGYGVRGGNMNSGRGGIAGGAGRGNNKP